uniref:NADH dehydrogenase subunit 2 n=1 Tax=Drawida ghilarovi TaxID=994964 RepID=UPI0021B631B4|nr:NADH dehydrogenase subunit 2 [Drawida ghilarovi]UIX22938.1 NADH dehydrogenase subunit 2 [Drawida ghilarovi]UIX22951.1 NADH dehydrogenase subunit 2 [Drawida ghilarovi]
MSIIMSPFMSLSISILIISSLLAMSSSNWIMLWVSMEINLLSFIPIILYSNLNQETEGAIKYFLAQAFGSSILLMMSTSLWLLNSIYSNFIYFFLVVALMMKLGSVPCHFWYPSVMSSISWMSCLILTTWQKLAPLSIIIFLLVQKSNLLLSIIGALNAMIGGMLGMNQSKMRNIMAYSSIGHIGWMLSLASIIMPMASIIYFIIYMTLIIPIFLIAHFFNIYSSKKMTKMVSYYPLTILMFSMFMLSLAGLPPLTGFIPKLMSIFLLMDKSIFIVIMLIVGSMMNLFFYLNIIINMLITPKTIFYFWPNSNIFNLKNMMLLLASMSIIFVPVIFL